MKKLYLGRIFARAHRRIDGALARNFSSYTANQRFARERLPESLVGVLDKIFAKPSQVESMYRQICDYTTDGQVQSYIDENPDMVRLAAKSLGKGALPIKEHIRRKLAADHTKEILQLQDDVLRKLTEKILAVQDHAKKRKNSMPHWFFKDQEDALEKTNKLVRHLKFNLHKVHLNEKGQLLLFSPSSEDRIFLLNGILDSMRESFELDTLRRELKEPQHGKD